MIDSHCHLADEVFAADLDEVVARARDAGLVHALCILAAGDAGEAAQAHRLRALWPAVRFAAGIHPHQAGTFEGREDEVERFVADALNAVDGTRAIGEIGLDYHYDFAPRAVQHEVFRRQVRLARARRLPVVIHTREAEDDTFSILHEEGGGDVRGIFHCFTGDAAMARRALDLDFHLSFAGIVTFPRAQTLRDVARDVPLNRLLTETDSPFLAPVPYRGKRNEPAWVTRVAQVVADARGESLAAVTAAVLANYEALIRP